MDRRELLRLTGLGAVTAVGAAVQAKDFQTVETRKDTSPFVKICADEALAVQEAVRQFPSGTPQAISVPFANIPVNYYARVGHEVRPSLPICPNLRSLSYSLRFDHSQSPVFVMDQVIRELWSRHRPAYYHEVETYPSRPQMVANRDFNKANGWPSLLADRVVTPRFIIDTAELDEYTLALMMCCVKEITHELDRKFQMCVEARDLTGADALASWEGDGWLSTLGVEIDRKAYMLEMFCHVIGAGVIYPIRQKFFRVPKDSAWLRARRQEPTHWHKLPFPMENKA